jgi:hypothetical protein
MLSRVSSRAISAASSRISSSVRSNFPTRISA